jgi:uncharacterized membrane protein SpoIIM required for sporulation
MLALQARTQAGHRPGRPRDGKAAVQEREFVEGSREAWERLAASVGHARKHGVSKLPAAELRQMHEDYRRTAADLAFAQTHFSGSETAVRLNRLVGQAHGELYGAAPRRVATLWRWVVRDYPRLLRTNWRPIALAAALLFGAVALGYLLTFVDYPLARMFLPVQFRDVVTGGFKPNAQSDATLAALSPLLGAFIGINNVYVSLQAFAGGLTFGVVTAYAMFQNGAMVGVLMGMFARAGQMLPFLALTVPHGALELPAIAIAGGAGMMLARALVFPRDLPRMTALRHAAGQSVRVVLGTVPMFVIAAFIEGFVTPRSFDPWLKVALGAVVFALFCAYVGLAGRGAAELERS